jgi:hypothetical protein
MLLRMSKDFDVASSNLHRIKSRVLVPYFFYEFDCELTGASTYD